MPAACSALVEFAAKNKEQVVVDMTGTPEEVLHKAVKNKEVVEWLKARRDHFAMSDERRRTRKPAGPVAKHILPLEDSEYERS